jgi:gluconolactonase
LWRFKLSDDGSLKLDSQRCLFDWQTSRGPDGIELDSEGRLYVAAGLNKPQPPFETVEPYRAGIYVLTPEGQLLDFMPIETDEVTNCSFGGPDLQSLYVTAGGTLWRVACKTTGRLP